MSLLARKASPDIPLLYEETAHRCRSAILLSSIRLSFPTDTYTLIGSPQSNNPPCSPPSLRSSPSNPISSLAITLRRPPPPTNHNSTSFAQNPHHHRCHNLSSDPHFSGLYPLMHHCSSIPKTNRPRQRFTSKKTTIPDRNTPRANPSQEKISRKQGNNLVSA